MAVCETGMTFADYMVNFEFIKAFTCVYFQSAGILVTGMFVYGAVATSIYIRTDSITIPFVLLLLTGGVVLSQVAAPGIAIATLLLLTAGAGVMTFLYRAYSQ